MAFNLSQDRLAETLEGVYLINFANFNWPLAVVESNQLSPNSVSAVKLAAEITGESRPSTDHTTGVNTVGVDIQSAPIPIFDEDIGYKITPKLANIAELEDNYNPIALQMRAAFYGMNKKLHNVVMNGHGDYKGLLTEELPSKNIINNTMKFSPKATSANDIYGLLAEGMSKVFENSSGRRMCNTLLMPVGAYAGMSNKIFEASPGISLLEAVRRAGQALTPETEGTNLAFRIIPTFSAKTAMRLYDRTPESIQFEIPMELTFADVQYVGHNEVYPGRYRFTPLVINDQEGMIEIQGVA